MNNLAIDIRSRHQFERIAVLMCLLGPRALSDYLINISTPATLPLMLDVARDYEGWLPDPDTMRVVGAVAFHTRDSRHWAQPPSKPRLNRDGQHMKDADGKGLWTPIITFSTKEVRDRWSAAAVAALLDSYPNALVADDGGAP